jgi:hypothetical protein
MQKFGWDFVVVLMVVIILFTGDRFLGLVGLVVCLAWMTGFVFDRAQRTVTGLTLGSALLPLGFASAYSLFDDGTCLSESQMSATDFIYFSYTTYTTLGYGEIQPIGYCRLITSLEAMMGLIFVAYVAALFFRTFGDTKVGD